MNSEPVFPFGKHAGEKPADVPSSYLNWWLGNVKSSSDLEAAIKNALDERDDTGAVNDGYQSPFTGRGSHGRGYFK